MPKKNEFVEHILDMLSEFGQVRARAMFGGYGLYFNDKFFAIIADNELYIKVDDQNRKHFEEIGSHPFRIIFKGRESEMSYWKAPEEALDNPHELFKWAELGYQAALRTKK